MRYFVKDVPYCRQVAVNYCGSACAEMVLGAHQSDPPPQEDLKQKASQIASSSAIGMDLAWNSTPEGLLGSLQFFNNSTYPSFSLSKEPDADRLAQKIATAICQFSETAPTAPPIALVFGFLHWVVVFECWVDQGEIQGFTIYNPAPDTEYIHAFAKTPNHIAYRWWKERYSTGIPPQESPLFLAVSTPQDIPGCQLTTLPATNPSGQLTLISEAKAKQTALDGLAEHGLYEVSPWKEALKDSSPGKPSLIASMGRGDLPWNGVHFYNVPIRSDANKIVVVVLVDAQAGVYGEARLVPTATGMPWAGFPVRTDVRIRSSQEVRKSLIGSRAPGRLEDVLLDETNFEVEEDLVWQPCVASLSPYHPFHRVTLLPEKREHFFVGTQVIPGGPERDQETFPIFVDIPGMYRRDP